ncbi:MAG TPA: hypothetical protein DCP31_14145 [Cyanobacteria bacterium UBA8543]|nr:hypothetical protein [Cyanobacteria bacterium UBA8543]
MRGFSLIQFSLVSLLTYLATFFASQRHRHRRDQFKLLPSNPHNNSCATLLSQVEPMTYLRLNAEDLFHLESSGCLYPPEIISPVSDSARCLGEQFHLIMQQSFMGIPIDSLLSNYHQLEQWFSQLQLLAPELWAEKANTWKTHSHRSEYFYDNVILCSNFDLLIYGYEQLEIVNWTTDAQFNLAEEQWQWRTQLDLFLMAKTNTYSPEQIRLTYWLLTHATHPIKISIHYSSQALLAFKTRLDQTLSKLSGVLPKPVSDRRDNGNTQHSQNSLSTLENCDRASPAHLCDRSNIQPCRDMPPDRERRERTQLSQPVQETTATIDDSLNQFISGKLSLKEYIDSVPEVEL